MKSVSYIAPDHLLGYLLKNAYFSGTRVSRHQPWRVGVCVSGGPDSMALAYLLRHMPHPFADGVRAFLPYAFIIDHGARNGSHQEALSVKQQLEAMDIQSFVEKLEWHPDAEPGFIRGFEMKARDRRYRALTRLAGTHQLHDLFTGHHEDDQIETVMLRLLRDKQLNPLSFRGMATISSVPTADEFQDSGAYSYPGQVAKALSQQHVSVTLPRDEVYRTGVRLHRPLLEYRKNQLIATCEHFNIPYVQDKTNFDSQLTPRNAIRAVRTHHKLPKALGSENLLDLRAKANEIYANLEQKARLFLDHILDFDLHNETGVLFLRLDALPDPMTVAQSRAFSFFMQRLISIVSPLKEESMPSMLNQDCTDQLYALCIPQAVRASTKPTSLVYNQVVCTRLADNASLTSTVLRLARQPISLGNTSLLTQAFELDRGSITSEPDHCHSQWFLWDQRFWIRIHGRIKEVTEATLRPYNQSDVHGIRTVLKERGLLKRFEGLLSQYAPGDIRFTLPVLLVQGKIIAFPTLNLSVSPTSPVSWQVLYRRSRRTTDFFFPDIQDEQAIVWDFRRGHSVREKQG